MFGQAGAFGAPQSTPSLFGVSAQPLAFGSPTLGAAPGASSFGAPAPSSSSLFGAPASGGGLFGGPTSSSSGLFGTSTGGGMFSAPAQSGGGLFGAPGSGAGGLFGGTGSSLFSAAASSATSLFGGSSGGGLFGAPGGSFLGSSSGGLLGASTPSPGGLFGGPAASAGSLFGGAPAAGGIGPSSGVSLFGSSMPGASMFGQTGAMVPAAAETGNYVQQAGAQLHRAVDGKPVTNRTPVKSLPDAWVKQLRAVHAEVQKLRQQRIALATTATAFSEDAERAAAHEAVRRHVASARSLRGGLEDGLRTVESLRPRVLGVMRGVEDASRSLRLNTVKREMALAQSQQQVQQLAAAHADILSFSAVCPSPFLEAAIDAFDGELRTLQDTANELAALVPDARGAVATGASSASTLAALPSVLRTLHEYFITVAAGVARLRDASRLVRAAYLRERAMAGDFYDPFADAERREAVLLGGGLDTVAAGAAPSAAQLGSFPPAEGPVATSLLALPAPS